MTPTPNPTAGMATEAIVAALRDAGRLSEGAPSEEQVKAAHRAYYDANPEGGYLQAMRAALTASGAAPQKPQALAPEKVADVIHHAFPADSPYRCTHIINAPCVALATALCEAAKRGELT